MNIAITADDSRPRCSPRQVSRPTWTTPTGSDVLDFANAVVRRNWLLREAANRDHRWPNENNSWDVVSRLLFPTEALPVTGRAICRWGCRVERLLSLWHPNDKPDALRAMFNRANGEAQRLDLGSVLCPTITGFMDEYRKLVDSAVHLFDGSPAYSGKPLSPMSLHSESPLRHLIHELRDAGPRLLIQIEKLKATQTPSFSRHRSVDEWLKVLKMLTGVKVSEDTFRRRRQGEAVPEYRVNPNSSRTSISLALADLPPNYTDDLQV